MNKLRTLQTSLLLSLIILLSAPMNLFAQQQNLLHTNRAWNKKGFSLAFYFQQVVIICAPGAT